MNCITNLDVQLKLYPTPSVIIGRLTLRKLIEIASDPKEERKVLLLCIITEKHCKEHHNGLFGTSVPCAT